PSPRVAEYSNPGLRDATPLWLFTSPTNARIKCSTYSSCDVLPRRTLLFESAINCERPRILATASAARQSPCRSRDFNQTWNWWIKLVIEYSLQRAHTVLAGGRMRGRLQLSCAGFGDQHRSRVSLVHAA